MQTKPILIVDDCRLTCAVARDILSEVGFEVRVAHSGLEANPHIYGRERPCLILLDVEMPMLNGDRKVRLLKERSSSRDIPVVLISSKPERELGELAQSSGADGFLTKPLTREKLLTAVGELNLSLPSKA